MAAHVEHSFAPYRYLLIFIDPPSRPVYVEVGDPRPQVGEITWLSI